MSTPHSNTRDKQGRLWVLRVRKDEFGTGIEVVLDGHRIAEFDPKPFHNLATDAVSIVRYWLPDEEGKRTL